MLSPKLKLKIKNNFSLILLGIFTTGAYFVTRLVNLTLIPVFVDEAIYIRWAQVMRAVESLRFLPLSDGKQPLFMWLVVPFLKIFSDPLVAGRFVSVLAGWGSMMGVFVLSFLLFRRKEISFFASALYLVSPFTFFFDRMALADGLLSCFFVWALTAAVFFVKGARARGGVAAGVLMGLALLTKSPALFLAILFPLTLILLQLKPKKKWSQVVLLGFFALLSYAIAVSFYSILRLGAEFHMIAIRNRDYVFSLGEVLTHPLNPFWGNFKAALSWLWILLTPPLFALGIMGIFVGLKKRFKESLLLLGWILVPFLGQGAIAKVYTSRYILFLIPLFLIFAAIPLASVLERVSRKAGVIAILSFLFLLPLYEVCLLLFSPQKAWLPARDRNGYLEIWTSGYGIKEAADYLRVIAKNEKILIGTEGFFGTLPDGLQIYLERVPNTTVIGLGQPIKGVPEKLTNSLKDNRVFLVVNDSRLEVEIGEKRLRLISQYPKAMTKDGEREELLLFEVLDQ